MSESKAESDALTPAPNSYSLLTLPDSIIFEISSHLEPSDLLTFASLCKKLRGDLLGEVILNAAAKYVHKALEGSWPELVQKGFIRSMEELSDESTYVSAKTHGIMGATAGDLIAHAFYATNMLNSYNTGLTALRRPDKLFVFSTEKRKELQGKFEKLASASKKASELMLKYRDDIPADLRGRVDATVGPLITAVKSVDLVHFKSPKS